jgi:cytochrome c oxidase assembly protein subunit 15
MRESSFALATAASALLLVVLGGLVHATGASLACPEWPLCGAAIDAGAFGGGPLLAFAHRAAAAAVAALVLALAVKVLRARSERGPRSLAFGALALVVVQGALGAAAVLLALPPAVSVAHLALSIALLATLVALAVRLRPVRPGRVPGAGRALVLAAAIAAYAQLLAGGAVRHLGAGLACGFDVPLCRDAVWPGGSAAVGLHLLHRYGGAVLGLFVILAAIRPAREALRRGEPERILPALLAPALVLGQAALGLATVATGVEPRVATAHLALGALLVADLLALWLALAPARAPRDVPSNAIRVSA